MNITTRRMHATPEQVWKILSDGWLYPLWVVGASRIREVDDHWPAEGAKLHHSFGVWPAVIDDDTEVLGSTPGAAVTLRARGWPMGEAQVVIRLTPVDGETEVSISEDAVSGPGKLIPEAARDVAIRWRNKETVRRLAYLVERRA